MKPWKHQVQALKFLMPRDHGALYTDMGSGKTRVMIELIKRKGWKRTIIVCPKKVGSNWVKEINKFAGKASILPLNLVDEPIDKRLATLKKNITSNQFGQLVVIINYESVWREPLRKYLLEKFKADAIICDESHRIKSASSKVSRFLDLMGKRTPNRFIMTGTPMAQSPLDIYGQYRFLNRDIFGSNFLNFKNRYANWTLSHSGFYMLNKSNPYKNLDELREKMYSCAFDVEVDLNLPPTMDIEVGFELEPSTQKLYKKLREDGIIELQEGVLDTGNALAVMLRLQQLTSGYAKLTDDNGVERVKQVDRARITALNELLGDLPPDEPVVIFAKFRKDIENIKEICKGMIAEVSGKANELEDWLEGKKQYLVVQISSGAEGINLTRAKYTIYYSLGHSLAQYKQSRKRVHRPGQTRPVIYYTLVAKIPKMKTIDENIVTSLQNNTKIIDSILKDTSWL